ncbi:hypothetical protein BTR14_17835 [Rhizobium rhizosphaerae]|uniref:Uncharacterized protein n=1 Tax=Xaviernesmea rhizosphaerae TaxID=1672749 RepID=A0ABX3P9H2_9HYPH|nr:hypothetical protein [Xaviernesmea rhizosphaerae]OQP84957.1 hypothetical protein BTR14_17835 [Xaviernesmea rhizosphaerae]
MKDKSNPGTGAGDRSATKSDAAGQFAKGMTSSDNNGVHSAKPTVITGSDDATANKRPDGKRVGTEFSPRYDERDMNEGEFRG